jgi:methyl-accepting chemotaxis protein
VTLRTRLILVTTAVVALLFGFSEWMSYRYITALLDQHETILVETTDHALALERLRTTREGALVSATTIRVLIAGATLLLAVAILNLVWFRVIYRPIRDLLRQVNLMGRGTWNCALRVERNDEIGELTTAFNHLGQELTHTFESINASSKLSALALIGGRLVREITAMRGQIAAAARGVESGTEAGRVAAGTLLGSVGGKLETLEARFQAEFDAELSAFAGGRTPAVSGDRRT